MLTNFVLEGYRPTQMMRPSLTICPDTRLGTARGRLICFSPLIFGKLYFPNEDPLTATLAAFGTSFIGFIGRPVGAAIFGHYGDRIGRKATLIATVHGYRDLSRRIRAYL